MSVDIDSKVVGYVSLMPGPSMFCCDKACLVAGSAALLRERIRTKSPQLISVSQIAKARFGEITAVIELGDSYAFDLPAYRRFYTLAQRAKKPWDLIDPDAVRTELVYVGITTPV